jgi:hypothetical protein
VWTRKVDLPLRTAEVPDEGPEAVVDVLHLAVGRVLVFLEEAVLRIPVRDHRQVLEGLQTLPMCRQ